MSRPCWRPRKTYESILAPRSRTTAGFTLVFLESTVAHARRAGVKCPRAGVWARNSRTHPDAKATFLERAWTWIHQTFPERQIYIRSDGRVQFFTFGPSLQATLAGLTLIFLGWVAFATVNVIFKDRIIAAKDHRYQQMQAAYENRVADLQISYDELNGALVGAEDRFKAVADGLQAKQNAIAGFLNRANQVQASVGIPAAAPAGQQPPASSAAPQSGSGSLDVEAPADFHIGEGGSSQLTMMPGPAAPQPRTARPLKSSFLDKTMKRVAALFQSVTGRLHVTPPAGQERYAAAYAQHPTLRALADQTTRVVHIGRDENVLMAKTESALGQGVGNLRTVMHRTGINPDSSDAQDRRPPGYRRPRNPAQPGAHRRHQRSRLHPRLSRRRRRARAVEHSIGGAGSCAAGHAGQRREL